MNDTAIDLFRHGGAAGRALADIDWRATPLGPVEGWPAALRVSLQMMLASSFPKAICWGPEMTTLHNDAFAPILGRKPSAQGSSFRDVWAEAWHEIGPIAEKALKGEATFIENFPLTIERHGYPEKCHFTFCYSPIYHEDGRVGGFIDTVIETTETVQAQHALRVRNAELAHRMKNTFAVVSAIVRRTLESAADTDEAWDKLGPRLGALYEAQKALTEGVLHAASMETVIARALAPHIGNLPEPCVQGPSLYLPEREAMAVSLAVNELATNAMKHGGLGKDHRLEIRWRPDGDDPDRFHFRWTETGGKARPDEDRRGFGRTLLERVIPQDISGHAEFTHDDGRLEYRLTGRIHPELPGTVSGLDRI